MEGGIGVGRRATLAMKRAGPDHRVLVPEEADRQEGHPGEAEGADVAVFAGNRRGIIYVQGQKVANVPEEEILDRLRSECLAFQEKVRSGEAKLGEKKVDIVPPDPIGDLGSGIEKIRAGLVEKPTIGRT